MEKIGRRIYFDIFTGSILAEIGERMGSVRKTTPEEDIQGLQQLSDRDSDTFDFIELSFGQYEECFINCIGYKVNIDKKEIEFIYPDPNEIVEEHTLYTECKSIINGKSYTSKEDMQSKLDMFLLNDRISQSEYEDLTSKLSS